MEENSGIHDKFGDEAIILAQEERWKEAVALNERIIDQSPNNINALNRMGKAYSELGQNAQAMEAYDRAAKIDPKNNIAHKSLARLSHIQDTKKSSRDGKSINSSFFIEETSKARAVNLYRLAPTQQLAKMSEGDEIFLNVKKGKTIAVSCTGKYLGEVDPQIGLRLVDLIRGGNKYQVAIIRLVEEEMKVIIRETFQHPSQAGHSSFPRKSVVEVKPYLKSTMIKYEIDSDSSETKEEDGRKAVGEEGVGEDEPEEESIPIIDDLDNPNDSAPSLRV